MNIVLIERYQVAQIKTEIIYTLLFVVLDGQDS